MAAEGMAFTDQGSVMAPLADGEAVTPDDTDELTRLTRALWVGGAGAITVLMKYDAVLTLSGVPAGTLLPLRVKRVNATGTDATLIVALW